MDFAHSKFQEKTDITLRIQKHCPNKIYYFANFISEGIIFRCEKLGPLQNRKRPHKQIGQKYTKIPKIVFFSMFICFWAIFEGCCVFLSCRGPSTSQIFRSCVGGTPCLRGEGPVLQNRGKAIEELRVSVMSMSVCPSSRPVFQFYRDNPDILAH